MTPRSKPSTLRSMATPPRLVFPPTPRARSSLRPGSEWRPRDQRRRGGARSRRRSNKQHLVLSLRLIGRNDLWFYRQSWDRTTAATVQTGRGLSAIVSISTARIPTTPCASFGNDVLVLAQEGVAGGDFLSWTGTHWDWGGGAAGAAKLAQKVGDMISLEADALTNSKAEIEAIEAGKAAAAELKGLGPEAAAVDENKLRVAELKDLVAGMKAAQAALAGRRKKRRQNGVAAKNGSRIKAMLECAAPHLRRAPDEFNANPLLVVARSSTLTFVREVDLECPDPDVTRYQWVLKATPGHRREDLVMAEVPIAYDPTFAGPKWQAFIERFLPQAAKRRTVQQFCGMGLTGLPIQLVMFHVGSGANAKSTFLETYTRALGPSFAVGLPAESIAGSGERGPGQASPDLARVFGKRVLRVLELKPGAPLQSALIKRLTGGEKIPVRHLHKGFFEFQPRAKVHMSGNDFPTFDGSDGGMRRRLLVAVWTEVIALEEQKDLEEVVADLLTEAPAILNWLIAGALDYLNSGLCVAGRRRVDRRLFQRHGPRRHVHSRPRGRCAGRERASAGDVPRLFGMVGGGDEEADERNPLRPHDEEKRVPTRRCAAPHVFGRPLGGSAGADVVRAVAGFLDMTRLFATPVAEQQPMDFDRCPMVERSTVAGGQRKQFNGLPAGIEGCDGFPPPYVYIFSWMPSAQSGTEFLYTRAEKLSQLSRHGAFGLVPSALLTHYKLSQNYLSTLATLEEGKAFRGRCSTEWSTRRCPNANARS